MIIARLTEESISIFAGWLDGLKDGSCIQVPVNLLDSPKAIHRLPVDVDVEPRKFSNRFEIAEYLFEKFATSELTDVDQDRGLWSWLSLFFIDEVCPVTADGSRIPGAVARHIPETGNFKRYYRHLIAGPYRIYKNFKVNPVAAMAVLCQPVHVPGDVVEQLASRQEIITNQGVLEAATRLYYDCKNNKIKRGAGGKGSGSARRFSDILDQLDLTWDLYSMSAEELIQVLPKEFDKFQNN